MSLHKESFVPATPFNFTATFHSVSTGSFIVASTNEDGTAANPWGNALELALDHAVSLQKKKGGKRTAVLYAPHLHLLPFCLPFLPCQYASFQQFLACALPGLLKAALMPVF